MSNPISKKEKRIWELGVLFGETSVVTVLLSRPKPYNTEELREFLSVRYNNKDFEEACKFAEQYNKDYRVKKDNKSDKDNNFSGSSFQQQEDILNGKK